MFKITNTWFNKHKTRNGSWTDAQWIALSVTYEQKLTSGWKQRLLGTYITLSQKQEFENAKYKYSPNTIKQRNKKVDRKRATL